MCILLDSGSNHLPLIMILLHFFKKWVSGKFWKSSNYIVWIYLYEEYENSKQLIEKQSSVDILMCCYFVSSVVYMGLKLQLSHWEN